MISVVIPFSNGQPVATKTLFETFGTFWNFWYCWKNFGLTFGTLNFGTLNFVTLNFGNLNFGTFIFGTIGTLFLFEQRGKPERPSWHWSHLWPCTLALQRHLPRSLQWLFSDPWELHRHSKGKKMILLSCFNIFESLRWQVGNPKWPGLHWSQFSPWNVGLQWHCPPRSQVSFLDPFELQLHTVQGLFSTFSFPAHVCPLLSCLSFLHSVQADQLYEKF